MTPSLLNKPVASPRNHRALGRWLGVAGVVIAPVGACVVVAGAILPWATFSLFGVPLNVPGALVWTGGVSASVGALALTRTRRWPVLGALLGLIPLYIGYQANQTMPRETVSRLLSLQRQFESVNGRLTLVGAPPIEPFGSSVGPRRDHSGPGPLWTLWGGAALTAGSLLQIAGDRFARACRSCGRLWSRERAQGKNGGPAFCPHCGAPAGPPVLCARCNGDLEPTDKFCPSCGVAIAADAAAVP